jgi:hypothetical protein
VGKKIPLRLYQSYNLKTILQWLAVIPNLLLKIVIKFLLMFLFFWYVNGFSINHLDFHPNIVYQTLFFWFVLVCLVYETSFVFYNVIKNDMVVFARTYQLSMTHTIRFLALYKDLENLLAYILPAYILGLIGKIPLKTCIFVLVFKCFFHQLSKILNRKIYLYPFVQKYATYLSIVSCIFCLFIGYLWYLFLPYMFLWSWPMFIIMILLNAILIKVLFNQKEDRHYIYALVSKSDKILQEVLADVKSENLSEGLRMQKKLTLEDGENFSHYHGSKMLNQLLFYRYRNQLQKNIKKQIIFFSIIFIIIFVAHFFIPVSNDVSKKGLVNIASILFLGMYILGFGKKVVQMCFVNCDRALLYYPFYREEKTVLSSFYERLKKIFILNLVPILGIFIDVLAINYFLNKSISPSFALFIFLLLIDLSLLFSFHELFIYYLMQPFAGDGSMKNPFYQWISGLFYLFCLYNNHLPFHGYDYLLFISVICILYVGIGLIVIRKKASKTFRIKT